LQTRSAKEAREYKTAGKGTPIVVFTKNPENTPEDKHYPAIGIALGITAVKEERQGRVPVLKLYDSFDPVVVRSATGPDPIAANYTATLAVFYSHARKVAGSAAASFLRPDNPRIATGIYLIHPYDPNKVPILFIHGLISSPISWQNLINDLCSDRKFSSTINLGFSSIRPASRSWKAPRNFARTCKQRNAYLIRKASRLLRTMSLSSLIAWEDYLRTLWYQTQARISGMCLRPSR
jgi:hypothetical protein